MANFVDVKMWLGILKEEPESMQAENIIPVSMIDYFELTENMFNVLPSFYISLGEGGSWGRTKLIKPGDTISIKLTPALNAGEAKPIMSAEYQVQTVTVGLSNEVFHNVIRIFCTYNAGAYLNEIVTYPEDNWINKADYQKKNATDVINDVLLGTSVGFACEKESTDSSYWLNCNETRAKFVERVVQHSWVGENDAPVTYVDRNGIMHFNTLRNMTSMPIGLTCAFASTTLADVNDPNIEFTSSEDEDKSVQEVIITDAKHINAAQPILNQGGYKLQYSVYNPYNSDKLSPFEYPKWGEGALGALANMVMPTSFGGSVEDPGDGFRSTEATCSENFLAGLTNKGSVETVSDNIDGGMVFDEMHDHYNIAPKYNETMRRSFFQTFVQFTIDTSKQASFFGKNDNFFKLGQVVMCKFGNDHGPDALHTGKYVVCKIKHIYQAKMPYNIEVTVVSDGYYGA